MNEYSNNLNNNYNGAFYGRQEDQKENFGFKRNKSEIEKEIIFENEKYIFINVLNFSYNKALIYQSKENENKIILMSYKTIVAEIEKNKKAVFFGWYSTTTAKHINDFLNLYGFNCNLSKKELQKGGCIEWKI